MNVQIEDVSPIEKKMVVEVPWDTISKKLNSAFRELGQGVTIKGFRKGKAPRAVLERMYGKRVKAEVMADLVRESFIAATSEHELAAVSEPRIEEIPTITKGQSLNFSAIVEVKGETKVETHEGLDVQKRKLVIPTESVDEGLAALQRDYTELGPIEDRKTTTDVDVITVKVEGNAGEIDLSHEGIEIDLGEPSRDPLPGMIAALTGIPVDATDHEIEITFPEDFANEDLKGTTATLKVTVLEAKTKIVPELDDEFAKDTEKAETLDGLKKHVEDEIRERLEKQIDRELRDSALTALVKANEIPVASALVERAISMRFRRLQSMLGMQPDNSPIDPEIKESMREGALREVRGQLLLEALADKLELEVTDDDLEAHVEELAQERDVPVAKFRAQIEREGQLESIRFSLRQDKALDVVIAAAKIEEVEKLDSDEPEHVHDENCNHDHDHGHDHDHDHGHGDDASDDG